MSRSFRKQLVGGKDRNPWAKNQANRRIRRKPVEYDIQDGGSFHKEFEQYTICDYAFLYFGPPALVKEYIGTWTWKRDSVDKIYSRMKFK
jgi:hypothetical protein